jgi:hypothetical protein
MIMPNRHKTIFISIMIVSVMISISFASAIDVSYSNHPPKQGPSGSIMQEINLCSKSQDPRNGGSSLNAVRGWCNTTRIKK